MSEEKAYAVGYKRPPQHTRFKPGQSGNPRGKAPGTLNLKTDLEQELAERIPIREGDRNLKVSKQRALLKAMVAKALKGDTRAASIVLQLVAKTIGSEQESTHAPDIITPDEADIVEDFIARRLHKPSKQPATGKTGSRATTDGDEGQDA